MSATTPNISTSPEDTTASSLDISAVTLSNSISTLSPSHAKSVLQHLLSHHTILLTSILSSIHQQEASSSLSTAAKTPFRSIGKGFCGEIYEKPGTGRIFKRELSDGVKKLWNDFRWHAVVYDEIVRANNEFEKFRAGDMQLPPLLVPKLYSYITPQNPTWWIANPAFSTIAPREMANLLEAERIPALPFIVRKALIALYYSHDGDKEAALRDPLNENCLVRIYLGVRRQRGVVRGGRGGFSLKNWEMDLQVIDELGLREEREFWAREMARGLAVLHWRCETDANDVEFILGSPPNPPHALTPREIIHLPPNTDTATFLATKQLTSPCSHIWLLDFNNCLEISMDEAGVEKACRAFWDNDPYYPRPILTGSKDEYDDGNEDGELWKVFVQAYLEFSEMYACREVWEMGLPRMFVDAVVKEAESRRQVANAGAPPPAGSGPLLPSSGRMPRDKRKGRQYPSLPSR